MLPEERVVKRIKEHLKNRSIWHFVYPANVTYGIPDIIAIYRGFFVGFEVKRDDNKGRGTILQDLTHNSIRNSGGFAGYVKTIEDVEELLERVDVYIETLSSKDN